MRKKNPALNCTEFDSWESSNGDRCVLSAVNNDDKYKCELDEALGIAYLSHGLVTPDQAVRLGYTDNKHHGCTELKTKREPKPTKPRKKKSNPQQLSLF